MRKLHWVSFFALALIFALSSLPADLQARTQSEGKQESNWSSQAAEQFYLSPDIAQQLLTKNEWQSHFDKMKGMSQEERMSYRKEWHKRLMQQARQKGMDVPGVPPEHGKEDRMGTSILP